MANSKSVYYTFRLESWDPLRVVAKKWDEDVSDEVPVAEYNVRPDGQGLSKCSCPAYRECKHVKCVVHARDAGFLDTLWEWMWHEKKGWTKLDDVRPIEEL